MQIQNTGSVAGNLCNASPAADGVPPLLALDASVELSSTKGVRQLPLHEFILGPRRTALRPGELVTAVLVPKPDAAAAAHFLKLGARKYLMISIVMASAVIERAYGWLAPAPRTRTVFSRSNPSIKDMTTLPLLSYQRE